MSVVVWQPHRRIMVADSYALGLISYARQTKQDKVRTLRWKNEAALVGMSSDHLGVPALVYDWLAAGADQEKKPELSVNENSDPNLDCMIATESGLWIMNSSLMPARIESTDLAIGSGAKFALGAMWAGRTAEEAVRCAIDCDPICSGPVRGWTLDNKRIEITRD